MKWMVSCGTTLDIMRMICILKMHCFQSKFTSTLAENFLLFTSDVLGYIWLKWWPISQSHNGLVAYLSVCEWSVSSPITKQYWYLKGQWCLFLFLYLTHIILIELLLLYVIVIVSHHNCFAFLSMCLSLSLKAIS